MAAGASSAPNAGRRRGSAPYRDAPVAPVDVEGVSHGLPRDRSGCPGHDDPVPSLSVTAKTGKVLWHCHAGCDQSRVTDAPIERGRWRPVGATVRRNGHGPAVAQRQPGRERRWDFVDPRTGGIPAVPVRGFAARNLAGLGRGDLALIATLTNESRGDNQLRTYVRERRAEVDAAIVERQGRREA